MLHKSGSRPEKFGVSVPKISIVIVTRNRQEKLLQCLFSLSNSEFTNFEVIVIDQSGDMINTQKFSKKFEHFYYVHSKQKGKSRGLNQALRLVHSPLIAFTDDDCIVDKKWVTNIYKTFANHRSVLGVFGKTLPYKPEKHFGYFCPAIFESKKPKAHLIYGDFKHWDCGYGNNMAFRKSFFKVSGGFKERLGPGSIGSNTEDGEVAVRALTSGKKIFYNPTIMVYHDRWITLYEKNIQSLSYICGEMACYSYFAFKGRRVGKDVLKDNFRMLFFSEPKNIVNCFFKLEANSISICFWWIARILACSRGLVVASWFFLMEKVYSENYGKATI